MCNLGSGSDRSTGPFPRPLARPRPCLAPPPGSPRGWDVGHGAIPLMFPARAEPPQPPRWGRGPGGGLVEGTGGRLLRQEFDFNIPCGRDGGLGAGGPQSAGACTNAAPCQTCSPARASPLWPQPPQGADVTRLHRWATASTPKPTAASIGGPVNTPRSLLTSGRAGEY